MLEGDTAAIIAGASAIGGGLIVAASNYVINRAQARDVQKAELQHLLVDLYGALERISERFLTRPPQTKIVGKLPPLVRSLRRRLIEPDFLQIAAETTNALSTATLIAPPELLPAISQLSDLLLRGNKDWRWEQEWYAARVTYVQACRKVLGSGAMSLPQSESQP